MLLLISILTPNRKNFITVMQNEINKTAKVVVGYFILSILTKAFFNTMEWWGICPTGPLPLPHH
jgi:hypothetical protein